MGLIANLIHDNCRQIDISSRELLVEHSLEGFVASKKPGFADDELKRQRQRNMLLCHEWEQIRSEAGLDCLALKGMALLGDVYEDFGQRQMSDIDILIREGDLESWRRYLEGLGYQLVRTRRWQANAFKWDFSRMSKQGEVVVELHTKLFYREKQINWWQYADLENNRLRPEACLAHLIGHLGYQHSFLKLNWLLDIHLFLKKHYREIDTDVFFGLLDQLPIKRSAQAVTYLLSRYFGHTSYVYGQGVLPWHLLFTEDFLLAPKKSFWRYQMVKFFIKDSLPQAMRYNILWMWSRLRPQFSR